MRALQRKLLIALRRVPNPISITFFYFFVGKRKKCLRCPFDYDFNDYVTKKNRKHIRVKPIVTVDRVQTLTV